MNPLARPFRFKGHRPTRTEPHPRNDAMAFCPVHEYDRWVCGVDCAVERLEYSRAARALSAYWRRQGMRIK